MKFWDNTTEDINKVKKIKMHKPVHEIIKVTFNNKKSSLVVYEDGTCESLDEALISRVEEKDHGKNTRDFAKPAFTIENPQLTNGIFSFAKVSNQEKHFCYTLVDEFTLKSNSDVKSFSLNRYGQETKLMSFTVTLGKSRKAEPALFTLWSDKRLFKQVLNFPNNVATSIGTLHSIIEPINSNSPLTMTAIGADCLAIYACKDNDDGSLVILYNTKYKIVQSSLPFKVYLSDFKLWSIRSNIFLALGGQLSVIPYRYAVDQLSSMVGSQSEFNLQGTVEKEMINEDSNYEENLFFDEDQTIVEGMEFKQPHVKSNFQKFRMSNMKPLVGADEIKTQLNELYREEFLVDLVRVDDQTSGTTQVKLMSNVDESFPVLSDNFEVFCSELEKLGCSEVEITNRVIPALLKTNRTEDVAIMLKRYNHVSEQMLVRIIKYLLKCPTGENGSTESEPVKHNQPSAFKVELNNKIRFPTANIFLSSIQSEYRDVLSIALCCSFDPQTIVKFLRKEITLNEMVTLMDHIYSILTTSFLDDFYDTRGNLVEGTDFDYDARLFEWIKLLLDSHYQQILLSHDTSLQKKLEDWLNLADKNVAILTEMNGMRQVLLKLSTNKQIQLAKKCNQWYSIEKLELY